MAIRTRGSKLVIDFRCYLPDGRRIRCVESEGNDTAQNRKRVEDKWRAIKYEIKHGRFDYLHFFPHGSKARHFTRAQADLDLKTFWDQWLLGKSLRENTLSFYAKAQEHALAFMGHMPLIEIDEDQLLIFRKYLEGQELKESTINRYVGVLCMVLARARAYKKGLIPVYPCEDLGRLTEQHTDIDPFSFEELQIWLQFLEKDFPEWHDLIFIWSRIGVRPGELYAMKWRYLDYFNAKYMVRHTRLDSGRMAPPKTRHSIRDLDLRPELLQAFRRQEARSRFRSDYIFINRLGRQLTPTYVKGKFKSLLRLARLKYRPPVQLRHTFATLHLAAGEQISWVSRMMGHSSAEITWKRYNRFIPNLTRADGSAFEQIMASKGQNGNNLVTANAKYLKLLPRSFVKNNQE